MSVTLPWANQTWPLHRVVTKDVWGGSSGAWTIQPSYDKFSPTKNSFGFEVLSYSRVALPATGEARIRFRYGRIDGKIIAPSEATAAAIGSAGRSWSSLTDKITFPDLRRKEVRIQAAPRPTIDATTGVMADPTWRTVWWGQCEYQESSDWPGAALPSGDIVFHCSDGLARTRSWPLNKHGMYLQDKALVLKNLVGHPGYNSADPNGITRGNKDTSNQTFDPTVDADGTSGDGLHNVGCHAWPGVGSVWTDQEAVEHALNIARPKNEPVFILYGSTDFYSQTSGSPWDVPEDDTAWDFLNRVCKRQRGRGLVFLDWSDDVASPVGTLGVRITVRPQTAEDITYTVVAVGNNTSTTSAPSPGTSSGGTVTLKGAANSAVLSTVTVDLIGDHRSNANAFSLGDRDQHRVDYLESRGERIEVLVTLSRYDGHDDTNNTSTIISLENRWVTAQETQFSALAPQARIDEAFRPVYQLYGIPHSWEGKAGDHNNGKTVPMHRADYRCNDDGNILTPSVRSADGRGNNAIADTSPLEVQVMPDLPLLEGYIYKDGSNVPTRKDTLAESGAPPRRPPLVLVRVGSDRYITGEMVDPPVGIHVSKDGIYMAAPGDITQTEAYRVIGTPGTSNLGSRYDNSTIGCTVGIRLPHHVRYATTGTDRNGATLPADSIRRRRTITHNNIHLWLASPGAIWDLDSASRSDSVQGYKGLRKACGASTDKPGVLRDDRQALANLHALAASWYLHERRAARWGLKACGFLPNFTYADGNGGAGGTTTYPTLGQLVTTIAAAGQTNVINTPITSITYDNESGETTWATDWAELDFVQ